MDKKRMLMRDYTALYEAYEMPINVVEDFGDPYDILRSEECDTEVVQAGKERDRYYILVEVSSRSREHTPYRIKYFFDKRQKYFDDLGFDIAPENELEVTSFPKHGDCGSVTHDSREDETHLCIHYIASRRHLEREMEKISQKKFNETLTLQKRYREYDNPALFFIFEEYPEDVKSLFNDLEKDTRLKLSAFKKRNTLLWYLKFRDDAEMFPTKYADISDLWLMDAVASYYYDSHRMVRKN